MLQKELIISEINKVHKLSEELSEKIKNEENIEIKKTLSFHYFQLISIREELDRFIEFNVKQKIDTLLNEIKEL